MEFLVQLILGGAFIACFVMAVIFIAKGLVLKGTGGEQSKKSLLQFLVIESVFFMLFLIVLKINMREKLSIGIAIFVSFICTLFANIPIAIIAAIINFFTKKSQKR